MRVLRLNRCAALREVGFNIEEDGVVAKITGHMSICATRCSDSDSLILEIKLPNGHLLDCKTSCVAPPSAAWCTLQLRGSSFCSATHQQRLSRILGKKNPA